MKIKTRIHTNILPFFLKEILYPSEMKMQQGASERRVYKREAHTQATSNDVASSFPMGIHGTRSRLAASSFLMGIYFSVIFFLAFFPLTKVTAIELADVVSFEVADINSQTNNVELRLITKDNFKIYQENLSFELIAEGAFPQTLTYTATPEATLIFDSFSNTKKYVFENGTSLVLPLDSAVRGGEKLLISVQACSVGVCLLPSHLAVILENGAKSVFADKTQGFGSYTKNLSTAQAPQAEKVQQKTIGNISPLPPQDTSLSSMTLKFFQTGSIFLFPILFLAGLLTNLTPCVYPMIPITIGVMNQFGKHHKSQLQLSLMYVFGMVITYSLLGVIAAMTGQVFGAQLASPFLNAVVAIVMVLLGLAMLDFFDLSFLQRLSYKIPFAKKSPILAVGTMGAVSGLVAAPCTGPILSMILVLIAQTRQPVTGFIYMLCFALGFGLPYIVLGFVSQKLTKLPKMHRVSGMIKLIFACFMFALAMYFLKTILSASNIFSFFYVKPSISDIIAVIILLILFAGIKKPKFKFISKIGNIGVVTLLSLLCLWLTLWLSNAFISPYAQRSSIAFEDMLKTSQIHWQQDLNVASAQARKENKKILVDVWAEWCTACLEMEETTWRDEKIVKIIADKYVAVKLDYTRPTEMVSDQLNTWHIVGLPAVLVLDPDQNNTPLEVNQGIVSTKELLQKLSKY